MGLLGGDERKLFIADVVIFGVSSAVFWMVRRLSRTWKLHKSTREIVSYAMLANMIRCVMGLFTLFSIFTTDRAPGKTFIFTRWLAYPLIFGGPGMTHALLGFLHQHRYHTRWVISVSTFGFAALCALGVNFAPDADQHIVLLVLAGAFLIAGILALFKSSKRRDAVARFVTFLVSLGHIGYAIVLCLSPLVANRMSMLVTDGIYLGLDVAQLILITLIILLFHCSSEALVAHGQEDGAQQQQLAVDQVTYL